MCGGCRVCVPCAVRCHDELEECGGERTCGVKPARSARDADAGAEGKRGAARRIASGGQTGCRRVFACRL
jgi:hypothetical protein